MDTKILLKSHIICTLHFMVKIQISIRFADFFLTTRPYLAFTTNVFRINFVKNRVRFLFQQNCLHGVLVNKG